MSYSRKLIEPEEGVLGASHLQLVGQKQWVTRLGLRWGHLVGLSTYPWGLRLSLGGRCYSWEKVLDWGGSHSRSGVVQGSTHQLENQDICKQMPPAQEFCTHLPHGLGLFLSEMSVFLIRFSKGNPLRILRNLRVVLLYQPTQDLYLSILLILITQ